MRLDALIEKLQMIQEDLEFLHNQGPDDGEAFDPSSVEVRFMSQPSYPLEYAIAPQVITNHQIDEIEEYAREVGEGDAYADQPIVYLLEGSQIGYGRRKAWEV